MKISKREFGLPETAALFAIAASGLLTSVMSALDGRALPTGVAGTALLAYGIITTLRVGVIGGFGLMGVTAVIAMSSLDPVLAILVMAPAAVILVALVPAVDIAFTARRETVVHPTLVPGMVRVHVIAAVAGSAWALTVVSLLVLVDWPAVSVTAAMALLALVVFVIAAGVTRANATRSRVTQSPPEVTR